MSKQYKLIEPTKKPLSERLPFYAFATFLIGFMLYIMIIRPMSLPANEMPFQFATDPREQKSQYIMLTGGAMLLAFVATIPVERNSRKHDYALAKMWANREYIEHEEYMELMDILKPYVWKNNGADAMLAELQVRVNKHKGKHITGHKYFKKQYIKDLQAA